MRISPLLLIVLWIPLRLPALTPASRTDVINDLQQGRADHALELLQPVTTAGSTDAEAQQLLCRLALQLERWNDAVDACQKAVALDPQQQQQSSLVWTRTRGRRRTASHS